MSATPGPWKARRINPQEWAIDTGPDPTLGHSAWHAMAVVYGNDDDKKHGAIVCAANARLLAAAPELLNALQLMLDYGSEDRVLVAARAAITKATGGAA